MTTTPAGITRLANCFIVVDDHDAALTFYRDVLGLEVRQDVSHEGFRWLSVGQPGGEGPDLTIQSVGLHPGCSEQDRTVMSDLLAKGLMGSLIFETADVDALFEHVNAAGAEVIQEPADQFYGVRDCAFRDPAGNMIRFNTPLPEQGPSDQPVPQ